MISNFDIKELEEVARTGHASSSLVQRMAKALLNSCEKRGVHISFSYNIAAVETDLIAEALRSNRKNIGAR